MPRAEPFRPDTMTFVAGLVGRLSTVPTGGVAGTGGAAVAYADLLDRALADRVIDDDELRSLAELAEAWSLTPEQIADINYSYVTALAGVALSNGVLSRNELGDLTRVARLLSVSDDAMERLLAGAESAARHGFGRTRISGFSSELAGKSVYFADHIGCAVGGRSITDGEAQLLAAAAGLVIAPSLSPAADIVVVAPQDDERPEIDEMRRFGV